MNLSDLIKRGFVLFDIGLLLKELRTQVNLNQKQLAEKINVSVTTIRRWELNYERPSIERLIQLSDFYNVPLDYLTGNKKKSIMIDDLSEIQKELLVTLIQEFEDKNTKKINKFGLSERQHRILDYLCMEFQKKTILP